MRRNGFHSQSVEVCVRLVTQAALSVETGMASSVQEPVFERKTNFAPESRSKWRFSYMCFHNFWQTHKFGVRLLWKRTFSRRICKNFECFRNQKYQFARTVHTSACLLHMYVSRCAFIYVLQFGTETRTPHKILPIRKPLDAFLFFFTGTTPTYDILFR